MPKKMELALRKFARAKGAKRGSKRYNAIVFGTMNEKGLLKRRGKRHGRARSRRKM